MQSQSSGIYNRWMCVCVCVRHLMFLLCNIWRLFFPFSSSSLHSVTAISNPNNHQYYRKKCVDELLFANWFDSDATYFQFGNINITSITAIWCVCVLLDVFKFTWSKRMNKNPSKRRSTFIGVCVYACICDSRSCCWII